MKTIRTLAAALALFALAVPALTTATAAASVPSCATSGLVEWFYNPPGSATAGSFYYDLEFTNQSGHTCTIHGYPKVTGVGITGHQLGTAAGHNPAHSARTVTLSKGKTAMAVLQVTDAGNFPPSTCRPTAAAGVRVSPPGQKATKTVPFPYQACAKAGPVYLHVEAVQAPTL
jgi:hypothetical protein